MKNVITSVRCDGDGWFVGYGLGDWPSRSYRFWYFEAE
jgi:hypothetical protein